MWESYAQGHQLHMKVILVSEQHGFRKGIYTENIPIRLTERVLKSINQNAHLRFFQWFDNGFELCETWNFVRYTTFPLHSRNKWKVNADCFRPFLTENKHKGEIKSPNETQNYFSDWGDFKTWYFPRVSSKPFILHNTYVLLPPENKCLTKTPDICWLH